MGCSASTEATDPIAAQPKLAPGVPDGAGPRKVVSGEASAAQRAKSNGTTSTAPKSHDIASPSDASTSSSASGARSPKNGSLPPFHPNTAVRDDVKFDTSNVSGSETGHVPGYSSGASTPTESLDGSTHKGRNPKTLLHSSSILGLDKMIEDRKGDGNLTNNVVHIEVPFGKPIEEVYDGVHDGPVLGSGISGLVRLISHKSTGVKYAVKCLDLGLVETEEGLQQLREEIYIMCQLDHPNIVRLEEVYESHSEIYLVQELCLGGELFDRLDEQPDYHYTEAQCARLVKQMLCSVRYIHSKGIIHRDLKLENFLFSNTSPDSELKMIDFGLSKHFKFGEVQHEAVGTPYTVAPEVIRGCYDERCDVWAIGVITYLLLSGDPPFGGCGGPEPLMQVRENILRGKFEFEPEEVWENVSQQARNFIISLLVTDPNRRPTAREVQKSTWLREWASRDRKHEDPKLNPNVVKSLVNFKEYSDMRKLLCEVLSFTLLPDQIADLRREFEKMDTDGSGEISLAGLKHVLMENAGAGSLGALTEEEVEDIFNAMRVRKTETRIHWHEFIAAGLSHCQVDERNLKLAFDRLDSDHKGYITFDNVMDLMGNDATESEDAMKRMWGDSMRACNSNQARITYDDFLLLMKGQTREDRPGLMGVSSRGLGRGAALDTLHEGVHAVSDDESPEKPPSGEAQDENLLVLPSGDVVSINDGAVISELAPSASAGLKRASMTSDSSQGEGATKRQSIGSVSSMPRQQQSMSVSAPNTPLGMYARAGPDLDEMSEGPLTMEDDDLDEMISEAADKSVKLGLLETQNGVFSVPSFEGVSSTGDLTPPQSPRRGAVDFITPVSQRDKLSSPNSLKNPVLADSSIERPEFYRRRSRSVDDQDNADAEFEDEPAPLFAPDVRRAMAIPEHNHTQKEIDSIIRDESKTPLVVNRKLYRAHRQMRLAVLEASKRFEEQRMARERERLQAQNQDLFIPAAGLTMRHGHMKEVSSESIRHIMMQNQKQQQTMVEKATRRGGRGRRSRKKTISDMTGMLSSPPPEEMLMDPTPKADDKAAEKEKDENLNSSQNPLPTNPLGRHATEPVSSDSHDQFEMHDYHRKPTTPGVFRKTVDPFAEMTDRIYGLEAMSNSTSNIGGHGQWSMPGSTFATIKANPKPGIVTGPNRGLPGQKQSVGFMEKKTNELEDGSRHSMKSSASDSNLPDFAAEESASSPEGNSPAPVSGTSQSKKMHDSWPPPPPL